MQAFQRKMSTKVPSPRRRTQNRAPRFPGDPRYGIVVKPPANDLACLRKKSFLSTAVLDYIIQHTVLAPDSSSAEPPDPPPMLGSLGAETFISSMNLTASIKREETKTSLDWKMYQDHIRKVRTKFKNFLNHNIEDGDVPQRLIIPVVSPPHQIGHFFVACFDFSVNAPEFFVNVCFYDSLERSQKRIHRSSNAADVVSMVNSFFNSYILHDSKYQDLQQSDVALLRRVEYRDCPRQLNGYDCGIFAVAVVLHLLDRKLVDTTAFTQSDVTEGRNHLARALNARSHVIPDTTSKHFRNCFPLLAETIECTDVDVISSPLSASDVVEVKIEQGLKTNKLLSRKRMKWNGGNNNLGHLHCERITRATEMSPRMKTRSTGTAMNATASTRDSTREMTTKIATNKKAKKNDDDDEFINSSASDTETEVTGAGSKKAENDDSVSAMTGDTSFYDVMREAELQCFPTLEAVNPIVEAYEARTGNYLRIKRSINDKFRVYECREHLECPFQIRISRRRSDGAFVVSKMKTKHSDVRREAMAKDGRKWKKRRHAKLNDIVVQVLKTKDGYPTPADVIKTAANHSGIILPYMAAYRALTKDVGIGRRLTVKSFEQMTPYLEEMKKCNPMSVIGCTKTETHELVDVYFFPGFMNDALKFVRPVVSLDAAHLRTEYKGTWYIASVLSGNNDVFPIGVMISSGNEDRATWTKMLTLLKDAFPILVEHGFHGMEATPLCECPFVFVSDRDKGLKPALKEVFPTNLEFSCAKHIESNVTQRFGKQCGRYVMAMAKTYSARNASNMLDQVRQLKPSAAAYLENIDNSGVLWKSSQWITNSVQQPFLPPRYGIITSNTSECVNNMFTQARDLPWMGALEKIVDIMSTRIGDCRTKYLKREDAEVVPRVAQILKARWDAAASMAVMEIELGCGDFKVTAPEYGSSSTDEQGNDQDDDIGLSVALGSPMQQQSTHIVKPDALWCSCGAWQDCLFPCRHACAVYRKWKEVDLNYVFANLVHANYTFQNVKNTFKRNVFPVSLDGIQYDGATKPPLAPKRQSGRPKTKRIRRRSEFLIAEDSPVVCSNCGSRGHNRRTCTAPARQAPTELLTNGDVVPV